MRHQLLDLGLSPVGTRFRATSAAYIDRVEALVGTPLPAAYRAFLEQFGVATFSDSVAATLPGGGLVDVHVFLGNDPDDSYDLCQSYLSMCELQGPGILPVAIDPIGNAFCLTLQESPRFGVRYVDLGTDTAPWVADDFPAFLASLRRVP